MRPIITPIALLIFTLNSPTLLAEERTDHYTGKKAESIEQAHANLSKYNNKIATLLAADKLDPTAIQKIHNITYTLENALEHLEQELEQLKADLEEIHLASERGDADTINALAPDYLLKSKQLF